MDDLNLEFLKFIKVEGEKHLGIAVIRLNRRFIIRFKVQASEQGGYWISSPSMKAGVFNGKDNYISAFQFDSSYENEEVKNFVMEHIERLMSQQQASVFTPPAQAQGYTQQKPNYNQNTQHYQQQTFGASAQDENIPF